ncbi:MAG: ester cyclase [Nodosilinea sp. LVE1205-7]
MSNKDVVRFFFEIYNSQNYTNIYDCMAPDYYDHSLPSVRSIEDAIIILKATHKSFPDINVVIDDLIEEDDKVAFRGRFSATHLGTFLGVEPTNSRIEFEALELFKIKNHKIIESWGYWPTNVILRQMNTAL